MGKRFFRKGCLTVLVALMLCTAVRADEGMWLLPLLYKYNAQTMEALGLKILPDQIYHPDGVSLKDAVVIFGNGCTGEVISTQGLVLTNHHCGYNAIQQHSSVEHDYLKDGFMAKTLQDEIPTPGLTCTFLVKLVDVTEKMLDSVYPEMPEFQRNFTLENTAKYLEEEASKGTHYKAKVNSYYGGNKYYLSLYEVFTDIRMVAAPPSSIGKFGADTDNWMYPRHTGDFSLFRIYAGPDNKPADYSPNNKPYVPKRTFTISLAGYKEGDFAMILGNPGSTDRFMTSWEVQSTMDVENTDRALIRGIKQDVWMRHMEADPAVRIKYSAKYAQSANYWKNAIGQNEALARLGVVAAKQAEEAKFSEWVAGDAKREEKYGKALSMVRSGVAKLNAPQHVLNYYAEALFRGMEFNRFAGAFQEMPEALKENDLEYKTRIQDYVAGDLYEKGYKDYDPATDREATVAMLRLFKEKMPAEALPSFYETIDKKFKGDIQKYVDKLFETSIFTDYNRLKSFVMKPSAKKLGEDMGFQLSTSVRKKMAKYSLAMHAALEEVQAGNRLYIAGRLEMLGDKPSYPDANFTMRLTYGTVKGYSPRDAVDYRYYTTLKGVMEKENPESWEFQVPEKLKKLYEMKDYDRYAMPGKVMPVNFLTNNDITGGNSGSPVLNAYGELIGCAFDGNWESLSGDIAFEPNLQRCINVDIRYILFILERYLGGHRLVGEMYLVSQTHED